jgi:hypothetical protein
VETEIEAVMVVVDETGTEVAEAMVVEVAVEAADMAEAVVAAADMVAVVVEMEAVARVVNPAVILDLSTGRNTA